MSRAARLAWAAALLATSWAMLAQNTLHEWVPVKSGRAEAMDVDRLSINAAGNAVTFGMRRARLSGGYDYALIEGECTKLTMTVKGATSVDHAGQAVSAPAFGSNPEVAPPGSPAGEILAYVCSQRPWYRRLF